MRKRYAVVAMLGVVSVITFIDRTAIAVLAPWIRRDLGIGAAQWGWVLSAYVIAYGIFEIPSGALGDRNGQRRELARIAAWWSAFTALTGASARFIELVIVRFLFRHRLGGGLSQRRRSSLAVAAGTGAGARPGNRLGREPPRRCAGAAPPGAARSEPRLARGLLGSGGGGRRLGGVLVEMVSR